MGVRLSSGLISITALGGGDGAIATNAVTAWILGLNAKVAKIRKITWRNRTGGNGNLLIGVGDRTVAGSIFRQVFPSILMLNGIDGELTEDQLPIMGNTREGFAADTTPVTGTVGNILVETSTPGVGVAPADVQVIIEVEED